MDANSRSHAKRPAPASWKEFVQETDRLTSELRSAQKALEAAFSAYALLLDRLDGQSELRTVAKASNGLLGVAKDMHRRVEAMGDRVCKYGCARSSSGQRSAAMTLASALTSEDIIGLWQPHIYKQDRPRTRATEILAAAVAPDWLVSERAGELERAVFVASRRDAHSAQYERTLAALVYTLCPEGLPGVVGPPEEAPDVPPERALVLRAHIFRPDYCATRLPEAIVRDVASGRFGLYAGLTCPL